MTTQSLSTNVALGGVSFIDPLTVGATLRTSSEPRAANEIWRRFFRHRFSFEVRTQP